MAVGQNQWYHFGVGAPPILGPILVVGLGPVHWGLPDLDFEKPMAICDVISDPAGPGASPAQRGAVGLGPGTRSLRGLRERCPLLGTCLKHSWFPKGGLFQSHISWYRVCFKHHLLGRP